MVLPYLKGFLYFLCSIFGEWFGLFLILRVISEVYLQIYYWYITFGIRALSLAKEGKKFLVHFCRFFLKEKKGAAHFRLSSETFAQNLQKKLDI
jgi:hypothetical protein